MIAPFLFPDVFVVVAVVVVDDIIIMAVMQRNWKFGWNCCGTVVNIVNSAVDANVATVEERERNFNNRCIQRNIFEKLQPKLVNIYSEF